MNDTANEVMRRQKALQESVAFWMKAADDENAKVLRLEKGIERTATWAQGLADEVKRLRGLISEVIEDGGVQKGCLLFDELVAAVPSGNRTDGENDEQ